MTRISEPPRVAPDDLGAFCQGALTAIGVDRASAEAASRSMMHGSLHGVDSHGVRLLGHYFRAFEGGRLNKTPSLSHRRVKPGTALLDADHAQGAIAAYSATELACDIAQETGIAAVGIRNSSHFGPAGAYTMHAVDRGMVAMSFCNSDSIVRLHDGATKFHGTNPISMAVPTGEANPWLLDMATSAVPFNRVLLYRSLGVTLPEGVASDEHGIDTTDANAAEMLAPVGHEFGFKGAALAGISEIFSAVLTGMRLSPEILPMGGEDMTTPRELGAFVIVMDPEGFIGADLLKAGMTRYLQQLRSSETLPGHRVMAPGDREWEEKTRRLENGIPIDPATEADFSMISQQTGVRSPLE